MGNFLQAVGQARYRPDQAIRDYYTNKQNEAIRSETLRGLEIDRNLKERQLKAQQDFDTPMDANVLMTQIQGNGIAGQETAKKALQLASGMGFVNHDGTIKRGHVQTVGKMLMTDPKIVSEINTNILSEMQNQYKRITDMLNSTDDNGKPAINDKQKEQLLSAQKQLGQSIHKQRQAVVGAEKAATKFDDWMDPESYNEYLKTGDFGTLRKKQAESEKPSTTLGKLINEMNSLAQDDPMRDTYMKRIEKEIAQSGERITVGPDGTVEIARGQASTMQRKTTSTIEQKLFDTKEALSRLENIYESFDPKYQQIPTRLGFKWSQIKDKANLLDEKDAESLAEFSVYKQDAIDNINRYIKEITGAQMSEAEAGRLRKGVPDPGEGVFDGDSPVVFKAKLGRSIEILKRSEYRYNRYLKEGLNNNQIKQLVSSGQAVSLNPPVEGAKMAPDGKWYIKKKDGYYEVK